MLPRRQGGGPGEVYGIGVEEPDDATKDDSALNTNWNHIVVIDEKVPRLKN